MGLNRSKAIELVVPQYNNNRYGCVFFVRGQLDRLESEGLAVAPSARAEIETLLGHAVDDIDAGYTGEARTFLVDAMERVLDLQGQGTEPA